VLHEQGDRDVQRHDAVRSHQCVTPEKGRLSSEKGMGNEPGAGGFVVTSSIAKLGRKEVCIGCRGS
jgi:hypothetical protein